VRACPSPASVPDFRLPRRKCAHKRQDGGVGAEAAARCTRSGACVWVEATSASRQQPPGRRNWRCTCPSHPAAGARAFSWHEPTAAGRDEGLWTREAGDNGDDRHAPSPTAAWGVRSPARDRLTSGSTSPGDGAESARRAGASPSPAITATRRAAEATGSHAGQRTDNQGLQTIFRLFSEQAGTGSPPRTRAAQAGSSRRQCRWTCRGPQPHRRCRPHLLGARPRIRNVLVMTGDHTSSRDHPRGQDRFRPDSAPAALCGTMRHMGTRAPCLSGRGRTTQKPSPDSLLATPRGEPLRPLRRLARPTGSARR